MIGRRHATAVVLLALLVITLASSANSPLLQWRQPVYIAASFAGIVALMLLLLQPLLAATRIPFISRRQGRRCHRWLGVLIVFLVLTHIAGLWITSPPDVIDALLLVSPTPFSIWGVLAMWCVFLTAALGVARSYRQFSLSTWRLIHQVLAVAIVVSSAVHTLLLDGIMETVTKALLSVMVVSATIWVIIRKRFRPKG